MLSVASNDNNNNNNNNDNNNNNNVMMIILLCVCRCMWGECGSSEETWRFSRSENLHRTILCNIISYYIVLYYIQLFLICLHDDLQSIFCYIVVLYTTNYTLTTNYYRFCSFYLFASSNHLYEFTCILLQSYRYYLCYNILTFFLSSTILCYIIFANIFSPSFFFSYYCYW